MNKIGIITFTDKKYLDLSLELINSVLKFTNFNLTLFTIGFDYKHQNNRVSCIKIEPSIKSPNWQTTCFYKHEICSLSPYETTIYLDSDIIVTPEFQKFFLENEEKIQKSNTIFGIAHPHSPSTNLNFPVRPYINNFFKIFGVDEVHGYILASTYAFNKRLNGMFDILFKKDKILVDKNIIPIAGDEMTLNLYLHKNNLILDADCGVDFSPNYSEGFFESYISDTWKTCYKFIKDYKDYNRMVAPILFHGNKDVEYAKSMIEKLSTKFNIK
jgi:hypothetical protein